MKKLILILLCIIMIGSAAACGNTDGVRNTVNGNMKTYYEMNDGTWKCENYTYQYRLEIKGRMPNAAVDTTFVYLSNLEEIPFERAYLAAGVSSHTDDYFQPEDAVLVEMK
ncbi:MAG: immunogenic protein [Clostridia bacterium]|nr:immunogenic protein [Clostridia bacterium]